MTSTRRWQTGAVLPALLLPAVSFEALQRYADASGDDAGIHLDTQAARSFGFPDAIAHGLLVMAWAGRLITDQFPESAMRKFEVRFIDPVVIGDVLRCNGKVEETCSETGSEILDISIEIADERGSIKLTGLAKVATA